MPWPRHLNRRWATGDGKSPTNSFQRFTQAYHLSSYHRWHIHELSPLDDNAPFRLWLNEAQPVRLGRMQGLLVRTDDAPGTSRIARAATRPSRMVIGTSACVSSPWLGEEPEYPTMSQRPCTGITCSSAVIFCRTRPKRIRVGIRSTNSACAKGSAKSAPALQRGHSFWKRKGK